MMLNIVALPAIASAIVSASIAVHEEVWRPPHMWRAKRRGEL
jgi:hypothetical protein